jgi:ABC-type uncharacterized transport system ATPase subunit
VKLLSEPAEADLALKMETSPDRVQKDEEDPTTYLLSIERARITEIFQRLLSNFEVADIGIQEASLERVIQKIYQN